MAPEVPTVRFPLLSCSFPVPPPVTSALELSQGTFWKAKTQQEPSPNPALRSGGGPCAGSPHWGGQSARVGRAAGAAGRSGRTYFSHRRVALASFRSSTALLSPPLPPGAALALAVTRIRWGTRHPECLLVLAPERPLARVPNCRGPQLPPPGPQDLPALGEEEAVLKAPSWRLLNS